MYDDLLGPAPKPEKRKLKAKFNLSDNAKPANPDKYPSHRSSKDTDGHGSVSSCSDSGVNTDDVCNEDCSKCADDCEAPTPKDPWADVTPGPTPKPQDDDGKDDLPDLTFIGWEDDDCSGDCDNCTDDECKGISDLLGDFFEDEDEDAEGSWAK